MEKILHSLCTLFILALSGGDFFHSHLPILDHDHYQGKQNLRDRYLKPKYWHDSHESEWSSGNATRKGQLDNDLDDR